MIFRDTPLDGMKLIELDPRGDERGFFARTFCSDEFAAAGLPTRFVQQNLSFSRDRGTLRGLHYQLAPAAEAKLVRCTRGALWDVGLDLRPGSASFGRWHGVELSEDNRLALLVPEGFAHGFVTLSDSCEIAYLVTAPYTPSLERGVRWDDPRFAIEWPLEPALVSDRDRNHPDFDPGWHLASSAGR
jgi:dTDP-4-dehydrorhamnose 3,5-epimerase